MNFKTLAFSRLTGNFLSWFLGFVILSMTTYVNGPYSYTDAPIVILIGFLAGSIWSIRLHAYQEAQRIGKVVINHRNRLIARSALGLVIGLSFHLYCEGMDLNGAWSWPGWVAVARGLACTLYLASIFWLLFDFILNYDRGKALFYVSSWYQSSRADREFRKLNSPVLWLAMKLAGFIAMSIFYLNSFQW